MNKEEEKLNVFLTANGTILSEQDYAKAKELYKKIQQDKTADEIAERLKGHDGTYEGLSK